MSPGTHDTMTGMGFYQPLLKYVFNQTAISQVSTLGQRAFVLAVLSATALSGNDGYK